MEHSKKGLLIFILKVLEKYSDEKHCLTQQDIIQLVYKDYGLLFDRRTISSGINFLIEMDYDIVKVPNEGVFLGERLFDSTEVTYLIDALFSSKSISARKTKEISEKISSCLSKYQRKSFDYLYKCSELSSKTDNEQIFYSISKITEAIENKKKIAFKYMTYDSKGNKVTRMNDYVYHVSPYYLINNFGKYYLLCNYRSKYQDLQTFRIDFIKDLQVLDDEPRKELSELETVEKNFSITKYLNEHIYIYSGETISAKIELNNNNTIQYVKDWFGKNAIIFEENEKIYAIVNCNENALYYWVMQYNEHIKIISPQSLIDRVVETSNNLIEKYKK